MTTERIRLCLITKFFQPILAGGAERFRRYAPGLRERGIDLDVFMVLHPDYPDLSEHEVINDISITMIPVTNTYKDFPKLVHTTINQFQKPSRKPDIVQFYRITP